MPRIRTIKPEFPQSETIGRVSREARLLFIQLWTVADDSGRARGNSRVLASLLYPYDDDAKDLIESWLAELESVDAIRRYAVGSETYLEIENWSKHQKIDKPSPSKFPSFDEGSRVFAKPREDSSADLGSRIGRERKGEEGKGEDRDRSLSTAPSAPDRAVVERVFEHWRATHNHPQARLDERRRKIIRAALASYSESALCESIAGYRNSPHHMGQNDRGTVYDSIELLLRDAKHIDAGLAFARNPPRTDLSSLTRANVDRTADWRPPELRNAS